MNHELAAFVYREAQLLDDYRLEEWLGLFTADGLYWVPLDDGKGATETVSIMRDGRLEREERVFHTLQTRSAAQTPRSETVHVVSGVTVEPLAADRWRVRSAQVIYEMRRGDFRQTGLGAVQTHVATVFHELERAGSTFAIKQKKVLLLGRNAALGNLTFFL